MNDGVWGGAGGLGARAVPPLDGPLFTVWSDDFLVSSVGSGGSGGVSTGWGDLTGACGGVGGMLSVGGRMFSFAVTWAASVVPLCCQLRPDAPITQTQPQGAHLSL